MKSNIFFLFLTLSASNVALSMNEQPGCQVNTCTNANVFQKTTLQLLEGGAEYASIIQAYRNIPTARTEAEGAITEQIQAAIRQNYPDKQLPLRYATMNAQQIVEETRETLNRYAAKTEQDFIPRATPKAPAPKPNNEIVIMALLYARISK